MLCAPHGRVGTFAENTSTMPTEFKPYAALAGDLLIGLAASLRW